jgi:GTPase SAR1 family protein
MQRNPAPAVHLTEQLCRPQRVGVFGHRGVGKTTLLTVLYREAVAGRLPDLRLAAADVRTAEYLSDKLLQLEAGQPLPATLAETELRFHLYHGSTRIELLFKDYQGEHVALGREEPIRDFLRDCDALWICLDANALTTADECLRRQQEVEQLIEDYLAVEPGRTMVRPVALLLTKADLVEESAASTQWADAFAMTRHALRTHCPQSELFAVSCLNPRRAAEALVQPRNLGAPLIWLANALQTQDESRLQRLWSLTPQMTHVERSVACVVRRYPDASSTKQHQQRLRGAKQRQRRRRLLTIAASVAVLFSSVWGYDAFAYQRAARFGADHVDDPSAVLACWQSFQSWHPTRNWLRPGAASAEAERLRDLSRQARLQKGELRLAELRRRAADPDADPEAVWQQFQGFRADYPENDVAGELQQLRAAIKVRRDEQIAHRAQAAYDDLVTAEHSNGSDLLALITQADRFLNRYPGAAYEAEVRKRRDGYVNRLESGDIEIARSYSARQPLNFQTRREHYQRYLDKHSSGVFTNEAAAALRAIEADWDRHDFRSVRDHFVNKPGDIPELVARCRSYLAVHPQGQFTAAATELLRWSERVTTVGEYRVILRDGHFDKKVARFFSLGPDLSVEIEVAGVRYGPSNITVNQYDPQWQYEFPRRIRWKLGDPVRIIVTDHDYWRRAVVVIDSADDDPLAIRLLGCENWSGPNRVTFESDFALPHLPTIE